MLRVVFVEGDEDSQHNNTQVEEQDNVSMSVRSIHGKNYWSEI